MVPVSDIGNLNGWVRLGTMSEMWPVIVFEVPSELEGTFFLVCVRQCVNIQRVFGLYVYGS